MSSNGAPRPALSRRPRMLPFAQPDITDEEVGAVTETLRSGWLTTGPRVHEFETALTAYVGARHGVALTSGTAALHLALDAIGLTAGDEVIVPTYTFPATAEVVRYSGARPVLVDIAARDLNIDVDAVERAITPRTRAVIGVDIGGEPCDWPRLRELADRHKVFLIDDAAHALPSRLNGRLIGTWADLTAFSFYATKTLTTGEGGMLVTDNEAWAGRARSMSLHGISRDTSRQDDGLGNWLYEVQDAGYKYNLTDIAAAMGLVQLRRLDAMWNRRVQVARRYDQAFADMAALEAPLSMEKSQSSCHLYLLRLNQEELTIDRTEFIKRLAAANIATSVHFMPLHMHRYYRQTLGTRDRDFPVATREYQRVISLPIYSRMTDADTDDVTAAVQAIAEAAALSRG